MAPINVLIADDEINACKRIEYLLAQQDQFHIVDICHDGQEALSAIQRLRPQVIFLDIEMPKISGIDLVNKLPQDYQPIIVFISAYNKYAVAAFDFFALDYLLKPFTAARFHKTLDRIEDALKTKGTKQLQQQLAAFIHYNSTATTTNKKGPKKLAIPIGNKIFFIDPGNIIYVAAASNYVNIFMKTAKHILRETLQEFHNRLPEGDFIRIHKSYLINLHQLKEVKKESNGNHLVEMNDGTKLKVSKSYKQAFLKQIMR